MTRRPVFILNKDARALQQGDIHGVIESVCAGGGLQVGTLPRIMAPGRGTDVSTLARRAVASGADLVVAGGGDGTISAVASALAGTDIPLGVLPLGTLNHFAGDVGIPEDLDAAVRTALTGVPVSVDLGEVNGHIFLNNSGLGLYPEMVTDRQRQQRRGAGKWTATLKAAWRMFRWYPHLRAQVEIGEEILAVRTPFVFVGNNEYRMDGLMAGTREKLDEGTLLLVLARPEPRFLLVESMARVLLGGPEAVPEIEYRKAGEICIQSPHSRLHVALDGEVVVLKPPLHYRIRRQDLRVMVPHSRNRSEGSAA